MKASKIIISFLVTGVVLLFGYRIAQNSAQQEEPVEDVRRQVRLLQVEEYKEGTATIETIGQVESLQEVTMKSELNGPVTVVNVQIGDEVSAGDVLLELDHRALDAQVAQAAATISRMQASINQQFVGPTDQEKANAQAGIVQAQAGVTQAKAQLENTQVAGQTRIASAQAALKTAENNLRKNTNPNNSQVVQDAYEDAATTILSVPTKMFDALRDVDEIINAEDPATFNPYGNVLGAKESGSYIQAVLMYDHVKMRVQALADATISLDPSADQSQIDALLKQTQADIDLMQQYLYDIQSLLRNSITGGNLNEGTLSGFKATISGHQNSIDGLDATVTNAQQGIGLAKTSLQGNEIAYEKAKTDYENTKKQVDQDIALARAAVTVQEAVLQQAQAQYDLLVSDPRESDVATLRASLAEARAAYEQIASQRDKAIIIAPISGKVGSVPFKKGDLVSPGQVLVSLVNADGLQVKGFIPSTEINAVRSGMNAVVTTKDDVVVEASVVRVAPSIDEQTNKVEIIIGVSTSSEALVIGQYVDVAIEKNVDASENSSTYILPLAAVKVSPTVSSVFTVDAEGNIESHDVELGRIIGDSVEVLGGLSGIEQIVASVRGVSVQEKVDVIE